jgi:hypothetical protein
VSGDYRGHAANRPGELKDFAVEDDAGIFAGRDGPEDVCPHRAVRCREFDVFVVEDDHRFGF